MEIVSVAFSLVTLAFIMVLGIVSRVFKVFSSSDAKVLSNFVYSFALPSLFLMKISSLDLTQVDWMVFFYIFLPLLALGLFLLMLHLFKIINKETFVLFSLSIVFGSYAFFGVPFFLSLYDDSFSQMVVLIAGLLSMYGISGGLFLFEYATHRGNIFSSIQRVFLSPLMLSLLGGVVLSLLNVGLGIFENGLKLLGSAASPAAIFMLGIFIYDNFSLKMIRKIFGAVLFRTLAVPLAVFLFLFFFDHGHGFEMKQMIFLHSGIPAAISIAVMAQKYNYRPSEITAFVVLSSIASFPLLAGLFLFRLL